jgi:hypothetical protein
MRLDILDDLLHTIHDLGELKLCMSRANAELLGAFHVRQQLG